MACIRDCDFHPPDEVRVFTMPTSGVRRLDDDAFVAEVRDSHVTVRHYAFREHWRGWLPSGEAGVTVR